MNTLKFDKEPLLAQQLPVLISHIEWISANPFLIKTWHNAEDVTRRQEIEIHEQSGPFIKTFQPKKLFAIKIRFHEFPCQTQIHLGIKTLLLRGLGRVNIIYCASIGDQFWVGPDSRLRDCRSNKEPPAAYASMLHQFNATVDEKGFRSVFNCDMFKGW